jgi:hypothetical protein
MAWKRYNDITFSKVISPRKPTACIQTSSSLEPPYSVIHPITPVAKPLLLATAQGDQGSFAKLYSLTYAHRVMQVQLERGAAAIDGAVLPPRSHAWRIDCSNGCGASPRGSNLYRGHTNAGCVRSAAMKYNQPVTDGVYASARKKNSFTPGLKTKGRTGGSVSDSAQTTQPRKGSLFTQHTGLPPRKTK